MSLFDRTRRNSRLWRAVSMAMFFVAVACVAISFACAYAMADAALSGAWDRSLWLLVIAWVWVQIAKHIAELEQWV